MKCTCSLISHKTPRFLTVKATMASIQHKAALALEAAKHQLKSRAWFQGRERSLAELRQLAGKPQFPLYPFTEEGYMAEKAAAAERANAAARRAAEEEARLQKLFERRQRKTTGKRERKTA